MGEIDAPYTRQYAGTWPYLYSIWQTAIWGLGPALGVLLWAGGGTAVARWLRHGERTTAFLLAWVGPYLAITGLFYARYPRYWLPVIPVLAVLTIPLLRSIRRGWKRLTLGAAVITLTLLASITLLSTYAQPHSWESASEWIYRNVPPDSRLLVEEWDTALPLPMEVDGQYRQIDEYQIRALALYDEPDDAKKLEGLALALARADYVVIASRRVYGSVSRLPERYPWTTRYYERLFDGELGYTLVLESTRGLEWLNPRLAPLTGADPWRLKPDESLIVYDHPRVLVFANGERLSENDLLDRMQ